MSGPVISIRLPEVMAAKLNEAARVNHTTRTALIIDALVDYYPTKDEFIEFHTAKIGAENAEKLWKKR